MRCCFVVFVGLYLERVSSELSAADKARAAMARVSKQKVTNPNGPQLLPQRKEVEEKGAENESLIDQSREEEKKLKQTSIVRHEEEIRKRSVSAYRRLEVANTSHLLNIVSNKLELKWFELSVDSISDRRQLGVLGEEVLDIIPEAVQIGRRPVKIKSDNSAFEMQYIEKFFHVDQNLVLMHGLGALQELIKRQEQKNDQIVQMQQSINKQRQLFDDSHLKIQDALLEAAKEKDRLNASIANLHDLEQNQIIQAEIQAENYINLIISQLRTLAIQAEDLLQQQALEREDSDYRHLESQAIQLENLREQWLEEIRYLRKQKIESQNAANQLVIQALKRQALIATATARYQAKAQAERQNEDIRLRALRARAAQERKRLLEALAVGLTALGNGILRLLKDPDLLFKLITASLFIMIGAFFSKEFAALGRDLAEAYFGQPRLIRETSKKRFFIDKLKFLRTILSLFARQSHDTKHEQFLDDVILTDQVRSRLLQLASSTRNAKRNDAPFRHILLHGPPGTGKTLTAKKLAQASSLDYALMSGGDVGPLGVHGVTALHSLFRWAHSSERGVLIFIDEAEAFLASRDKARLTEHMRNALNAFLYHTGTPGNSFVIVLATNRPEDLDEAVLDRIDDAVEIGLPGLSHRLLLAEMYFNKYLRRSYPKSFFSRIISSCRLGTKYKTITISDDAVAQLETIANLTDGFSAREIEKLMVAVQSAAFGTPNQFLDASTLLAILERKRQEHHRKVDLISRQNSLQNAKQLQETDNIEKKIMRKLQQHIIHGDRQSSDPVDAIDLPEDVPEFVQNATIIRSSPPRATAVHATIIPPTEDEIHVADAIIIDDQMIDY